MWRLIVLLFCVVNISNSPHASAEEVKLPQGTKIALELFEKLHAAHEVAMNQKVQEDLYISLPLLAPNQSEPVAIANTSASTSPPRTRNREQRAADTETSLERRADVECNAKHFWEGQDLCKGNENDPRFIPCISPCTLIDRAWFLSRTNVRPLPNKCVFYTAYMSERARTFVDRHNAKYGDQLLTIWHIWDRGPWMRWDERAMDNPMRCIIQGDIGKRKHNKYRQSYFEIMSDTMAYLCGGRAVVMDRDLRRGTFGSVNRTGIWWHVEFPRLKMGAADKWQGRIVNEIDAIGEHNLEDANTKVWWKRWWVRGGPDWPVASPKRLKRDLSIGDKVEHSHVPNVTKRGYEPWDTSVFDIGGAGEIWW